MYTVTVTEDIQMKYDISRVRVWYSTELLSDNLMQLLLKLVQYQVGPVGLLYSEKYNLLLLFKTGCVSYHT